MEQAQRRELKTATDRSEARWLTVSPDDADGTELLLEPDSHPAVRPFKRVLVEDGIPFTSFAVEDVHAEHALHLPGRTAQTAHSLLRNRCG